MRAILLFFFFLFSNLFAADPVFDGLYHAGDLSQLHAKTVRIDLARYARVNANAFYHTDGNFLSAIDLFLPFMRIDQSLLFFDLRFTDFKGKAFVLDFGCGYRYLTQNEKQIYGLYGFYNRIKSPHHNFFSQITFGFEVKTKHIWADANIYIPIGKNVKRESFFQEVGPDLCSRQFFQNLFFKKGEEKLLHGFDAEVGFLASKIDDLRIFGGFYCFGTESGPTVTGPFIRTTYRIGSKMKRSIRLFDYITFESGARYDSKRKFDATLGFRLTIPLGGKSVRHEKGLRKYLNEQIR